MTQEEKRALCDKVMGIQTNSGEAENLFEEGKACDRLYARIFAAQARLLERLGEEENCDIIEMLDCADEICRLVGIKMFDYGAGLAK